MLVQELISSKNAIIFDLFHTLTSTETASQYGEPTADTLGLDRIKWNDFLVNNTRDRLIGKIQDPREIIKYIAHSINPDITIEQIELATKNRIHRFTDALLNIPEETLQVLNELKKQGKKLALLSNADVIEIAAWNSSPLIPFFDVVVFSCEVGYAKPEKEIYELTLERLNKTPEECAFVGDGGSNELTAAKEIGITPIMMTGIIKKLWPHKIDEIKKNADFVIENFYELLEK